MSDLFGTKETQVIKKKSESVKYVVSNDMAIEEIDAIEENFGSLDEIQTQVFLDAIKRGLLTFDRDSEKIVYKLEKPAGAIKECQFHELSTSELQEISKNDIVRANQKGEMSINMKETQLRRTVIALHKILGHSLLDIDKIKKRDIGVIMVIVDFLG